MKYMLDTNICIYLIKHKPIKVIKKFTTIKPEDVCVSSITVSELWYGVSKSSQIQKNSIALKEFLSPLRILDYDENASKIYGKIRTELEKKGKIIGSMDLLIAAHAFSKNLILITNNIKEFKRITGLKINNWV